VYWRAGDRPARGSNRGRRRKPRQRGTLRVPSGPPRYTSHRGRAVRAAPAGSPPVLRPGPGGSAPRTGPRAPRGALPAPRASSTV